MIVSIKTQRLALLPSIGFAILWTQRLSNLTISIFMISFRNSTRIILGFLSSVRVELYKWGGNDRIEYCPGI